MAVEITNHHFQNNRNLIGSAERVCHWVRRNRRSLRFSERSGSLWYGRNLVPMGPTVDHAQSVYWRKASADGLGFRPLQDLQRCVAALWPWHMRTGTHRRGAWTLHQGADWYSVQQVLLEVVNSPQGVARLWCAEQADCSLAGAVGFYTLDQDLEDNPAEIATMWLHWH